MWELLPKELQLLVVQTLVCDLEAHLRVENSDLRNAVLQARSVDLTFKRVVGHLWRLFTPAVFVGPMDSGVFCPSPGYVMRADAAESFVEGVMRHYCALSVHNRAVSTDTYSSFYTATYAACVTRQPYNLCNRFYVALQSVGRRLVEDGTLRRLQGVYQRDRWTRLMLHVFRVLDRWCLPRHGLPDVDATLRAIFIEPKPDTRAA